MQRITPITFLLLMSTISVSLSLAQPLGANDDAINASDSHEDYTGFVIQDSVYLPPPYVVEQQGGQLFLNGRPLDGDAVFGNNNNQRNEREGRNRNSASRLIRFLEEENGLLLVFENRAAAVQQGDALDLLLLLDSEKSSVEKQKEWERINIKNVSDLEVIELFDNFSPTHEFSTRLAAYKEMVERDQVQGNDPQGGLLNGPGSTMRLLTFIGMGLCVIAVGLLLSHRKPSGGRCKQNVDPSDVNTTMCCLGLITFLSAFDLSCTLIASCSSYGFFEMNPVAGPIVQKPFILASFKISITVLAIGILWWFRKRSIAQVASWWMSLVLTILAVRWVAIQSLFHS